MIVRAGGIPTRVTEMGAGRRLLLVHGFTGSIEAMAPLAARLAPTRLVCSFDVVGHGGSHIPATGPGAAMEVAVGQLVGVAGDDRPDVVGYSMGGRVVLSALAGHADRFRRAVVIGAHPGIEDPEAAAERRRADERLADTIEREGIEWFVDEWLSKPIFASLRRLDPEAYAQARRHRLANDPAGLANSLRGMGTGAQVPVWRALAAVDIPLLYLAGELDQRFVEIGRRLVGEMRSARLEVVPEVGHAAHEEDPGAVARVIDAFLSEG